MAGFSSCFLPVQLGYTQHRVNRMSPLWPAPSAASAIWGKAGRLPVPERRFRVSDRLFFYGTLRDPAVWNVVAGADAARTRRAPARLADHAVLRVAGEDFPVLRPHPGSTAEGVLVEGVTQGILARMQFFEGGGEYRLARFRVETGAGPVEAAIWVDGDREHPTDGPWDFARWQAERQPAFLEATVEYMDHFGRALPADVDIWHGIRIRAAARVAAAGERPVQTLRAGFTRADVESLGLDRPYARYFGVEDHRLRFRRFAGGLSDPVQRSAFVSGDAVTVLPYDPRRDAVLLIEQWRVGPWARGDQVPWTLEAVAGRRDMAESAEATARREAVEEAGLVLGRIECCAAYYPSPGILSEFITSFVGEADLAAAGGLHGLAGEQEDIRALVVPLATALAGIGTGEINNAPLVLSLLWLARERERLRAAWAAPAEPA
jgi:nudix-type nucleoside diphosphatase (YffH/AdpP family)